MYGVMLAAIGGAVGSSCRYLVGLVCAQIFSPIKWPVGTMIVNLVGCIAAGFIYRWFELRQSSFEQPHMLEARTFLMVGLLGGFTTFSAFSVETALMIRSGESLKAILYAAGTVGAGLLLVALGMKWCDQWFAP